MNNSNDYLLRKHKFCGNWNFDIESKNLVYADCAPTHHGLQCNFVGGCEEYNRIMELCKQLTEIIKEIDLINGPTFETSSSICTHEWEFKRLGQIGPKTMKCKKCGFIPR